MRRMGPYRSEQSRARSSADRASRFEREGREFDTLRAHQNREVGLSVDGAESVFAIEPTDQADERGIAWGTVEPQNGNPLALWRIVRLFDRDDRDAGEDVIAVHSPAS